MPKANLQEVVKNPGNGDQVKRLLQLLRDLDTMEAQKKAFLDEWNADYKSVVRNLQAIRQDIETGQKSIFEG